MFKNVTKLCPKSRVVNKWIHDSKIKIPKHAKQGVVNKLMTVKLYFICPKHAKGECLGKLTGKGWHSWWDGGWDQLYSV